MKTLFSRLIATFLFLSPIVAHAENSETLEVLSPLYTIDKIYKSMEGPQSSQQIALLKDQPPELLWITGLKTEMVGPDMKPSLPEFMCHVNLDFDMTDHRKRFAAISGVNPRIVTLSQGEINVRFPNGFGIPLMSNEMLNLWTQVLNHNIEQAHFQVRHKVTITFVRDRNLKKPMTALFNASVFGMKLMEGATTGRYNMPDTTNDSAHGPSCLPGVTAPNSKGANQFSDTFNHRFTGHWLVKPGREVTHSNVTNYLSLPYDTTVHFIAVHLHPYAESLELYDLTTGKTVYKSKARGFKTKIGLEHVDSYSSAAGLPLYKNHEYDLISTYNNTTTTDKDSMAVMLLFLKDAQFKKPVSVEASTHTVATSAFATSPALVLRPEQLTRRYRILLHTTNGDITLSLYRDAAPQTVAQFLALTRAGVYDTVRFYRLDPGFVLQLSNAYDRTVPLTPEQRVILKPLPAEFNTLPHRRGILSMARYDDNVNSGETSFSILLGDAPHLDGKYTVFGEVDSGMDVVKSIEVQPIKPDHEPVTTIRILKATVLVDSTTVTTDPLKK